MQISRDIKKMSSHPTSYLQLVSLHRNILQMVKGFVCLCPRAEGDESTSSRGYQLEKHQPWKHYLHALVKHCKTWIKPYINRDFPKFHYFSSQFFFRDQLVQVTDPEGCTADYEKHNEDILIEVFDKNKWKRSFLNNFHFLN